MKNILLILAAVLIVANAAAQKKNDNKKQPDEQIIVNKEYDEQGNLLKYDSTYTFEWYSDTSFHFPGFDGWKDFFGQQAPHRNFFPDDLFADSIMPRMPFFRDFPDSFFEDEWPSEGFRFHFGGPDSMFFRNFSFHQDTAFFFGPDSSFFLPPGFVLPDMKSFRDFFDEFGDLQDAESPMLRYFFEEPPRRFDRFQNEEQQREWEQLMEKHHREMEELQRKWEKKEGKSEPKRIY